MLYRTAVAPLQQQQQHTTHHKDSTMTMLHPTQYQHAQINRLSLRVYRAAWAVSLPASTKRPP